MRQEKTPEQKKPNYTVIELLLKDETNEDIPEEILNPLIDDIDNPRSFALLVKYIKRNIQTRLPIIIRALNFDFGSSPKSFDAYNDYKHQIEQLLEERDGVVDESKREQARLLLKVIKDTTVSE
ncbi:MAG: hypothetical protein UY23_C0006G0005 [Candidatus Jorgensenbacteria bacterium GW2011_GWA1_48_11]|uniref:Uncharacterized protein n=1 Tax=Candidatus Jorgensenbacteria bacterium GW2011_GWA1_48_11 TaxID=1618660 RepID=A0A0G1U9I6_9BACT|nr:MAG: hypothetical protein UY23_C0006G0005 [Candidatus Jorgensenbacteria bacterium GW2011_GWA1_48_11]KKW12427.1 MAG: hypothetical protein UY51_C0005G0669 [Candidatus Jorgensenbacteria bacterium GW2011_GWB1_49_9]